MIQNYLDTFGKGAINKIKDFFDPDMYFHVSDPDELKWFDKLHFKLKKMEKDGKIPKGSVDEIFTKAVGVTPSKKKYLAKYRRRGEKK